MSASAPLALTPLLESKGGGPDIISVSTHNGPLRLAVFGCLLLNTEDPSGTARQGQLLICRWLIGECHACLDFICSLGDRPRLMGAAQLKGPGEGTPCARRYTRFGLSLFFVKVAFQAYCWLIFGRSTELSGFRSWG